MKCASGPVLYNCIYDGEIYDANQEYFGWTSTGFDDSEWNNAVKVESPGGVLRSHTMPPVKVTQIIEPINEIKSSHETIVYDMGQNFAGSIRISIKV